MPGTSAKIRQDNTLIDRLTWLINLRWIAVTGVIITVFVLSEGLGISLLTVPLYAITGVLAVYNAVFFWGLRVRKSPLFLEHANALANIQITLDLLCLALLIHFSGGVENPFLFYFIFHVILASILLSRRAAFLQAAWAVMLVTAVALFEYRALWPHACLDRVFGASLHDQPAYVASILFVFTSTLGIAAYMTTSISAQLRKKEKNLEDANLQLNEKDRIKSEYVLRVTHDIREDLAAVQGCIEPVSKGITGPLSAPQKDLLERAERRNKQQIQYMNALLEITRLKLSQKFEMQVFSVPDLIRELAERVSPAIEKKKIKFEVRIAEEISEMRGVRVYLEEALLNLLKNAVKYTPQEGSVSLALTRKGTSLSAKVEDTGIGVPAGDLPHIFEEFYRGKNVVAKERKGTGLGLAIAKQIVEMHGGKIWVESEEDRGSSFYLEIPGLQ